MAYTYKDAWRAFKRSVGSDSARQDFLKEAADMGTQRLLHYERAEMYYDGDHRVQLTEREKEYLQASGYTYAENFCEPIVDAKGGAMRLTGFDSKDSDLNDFARELFDAEIRERQNRINRGTVKYGDYFVFVEPNPDGLPILSACRPHQAKIVYDSEAPLYGVKKWTTRRQSASNEKGDRIVRLNIYWPDSIQKFYSVSSDEDQWAAFRETDDDETETAFWTMDGTADGEPIGIPGIHFANKPNPFYGRSKLRGVIPLQDALNKAGIDHFWVMDAQGWPQQWGSGVTADGLKRHPGSLWTTEKEHARFGQLDPADPKNTIAGSESVIKRMAALSATPLYLMLAGAELPSGESGKVGESGFIREGEDFHDDNGPKWCELIRLCGRVHNAFGPSGEELSDDSLKADLEAKWKGIETRNEVDEANVAVLKQTLGVSTDSLLTEMGYDPDEERRKREANGEGAAAQLLANASAMQAPTRSEEAGGGEQPKQSPQNRVTR